MLILGTFIYTVNIFMHMVNQKKRRALVCRGCGKQRVIADEENKLCGECAALFQDGDLTEEDLKPLRKKTDGRPKGRKKPDIDLEVEDEREEDDVELSRVGYACDVCGKPVRRGQRKCACGVWLDWRGTDIEEDPEIVVCPRCGAICGYVDACSGCPHCGYEGD